MVNHTDWSYGCEPRFKVKSCTINDSKFIKVSNTDFYRYDYGCFPNRTYSECMDLCLKLCDCKGFEYKFTSSKGYKCYPKTLLLNGFQNPNSSTGDLYLRFPRDYHALHNGKEFTLNCPKRGIDDAVVLNRTYKKSLVSVWLKFFLWFTVGLGALEVVGFVLVWCLLFRTLENEAEDMQEYLLVATAGFRRYSFAELKKATKGFTEEIGRGSGGIVYRGVMSNARVAAIKRLEEANKQGSEAEFLAEVNTIGRLNHMNLIDVWGYCMEGKRQLLVYEYMEHGSLEQNLYANNGLDWKKRFEIAMGTARGLAYLHDECLEWVLHFDVKPKNIHLDSNYQPKVSDFGLSKLLKRGEPNNSKFLRIKGTRGYMAPEWVSNQPITSKVDVYCYRIVVLEILTGKSP